MDIEKFRKKYEKEIAKKKSKSRRKTKVSEKKRKLIFKPTLRISKPRFLDSIRIRRREVRRPSYSTRTEYDFFEKIGDYTYAYKLSDGSKIMYVWLRGKTGLWGALEPLKSHPKIYEISLYGERVKVSHRDFGILEVVFSDYSFGLKESLEVYENLLLASKSRVDYYTPVAIADFDGWRITFSLPSVSGKPELEAVRIIEVPSLINITGSLEVAAYLLYLTITPFSMIIYGDMGAGKTTLMNSILLSLLKIFPDLKMSVIEWARELILPEHVHRIIVSESGADMNMCIDTAIRGQRPHLIVLGELKGDEIKSWITASKAKATVTTFHAPSLNSLLSIIQDLMKAGLSVDSNPLNYFRKFIKMELYHAGMKRVLSQIVFFNENKEPIIIYENGHKISEKTFIEEIVEKTRNIIDPDSLSVYNLIKDKLKYFS